MQAEPAKAASIGKQVRNKLILLTTPLGNVKECARGPLVRTSCDATTWNTR